METPEEYANNNSNCSNEGGAGLAIVKGKRTKRQRGFFPPALPATSSTSSSDFSDSATEEDEDMANCLILLAQGGRAIDANPKPDSPAEEAGTTGTGGGIQKIEKFTSRRFAEAATTTNGKAGFYVYECKTCNKCFPSFQALGGHRASHKKPKIQKKEDDINNNVEISINAFTKPVAFPSNAAANPSGKPRVHECSICGSEFSSGQALGGHMRRHRPINLPETSSEAKKERALLSLDLNLPAPSEDDRSAMAFPFATKQPLAFSVSALVDCHY